MQNTQTTTTSSWWDGDRHDATDWESTYRLHADEVRRWAARLGGPALDADDVVHEVFLVVHDKLREFRGDAKLTTWLYRITERIVYRQRRRQRLARSVPGGGASAELPDDLPAERGCPHSEVERQQTSRLVQGALDGLPQKQRTAVILHEMEGQSGEEIAALMGAKVSTVWVWLHRGRAKCLERLRELTVADAAVLSEIH